MGKYSIGNSFDRTYCCDWLIAIFLREIGYGQRYISRVILAWYSHVHQNETMSFLAMKTRRF